MKENKQISLAEQDHNAQLRIQQTKSQGYEHYLAQVNGAAHELNKIPGEEARKLAQIIAGCYYMILDQGMGF